MPRDSLTEQEHGVKVRIFLPNQEVPFGGHPTLGTAIALYNVQRKLRKRGVGQRQSISQISLDLRVGKIPLDFREDTSGNVFGEMLQVEPIFRPIHDRETVAGLLGLKDSDIRADWPIQTVSTGLPFAIVPVKRLSTLESLDLDLSKVCAYLGRQTPKCDFYYVTRDTQDPEVVLRARSTFPNREDPATTAAAGSTAAWTVRYEIMRTEETAQIAQGVEIKRPSRISVRASKIGQQITNVRVGGNAVEVTIGEAFL